MKLAHQNRNREVLQEVQRALSPEVKQEPRRTRIVDHTNEIRNSDEYRELASYGSHAGIYNAACHGCLVAPYCSAGTLVGYITTPKYCKQSREAAAAAVLQLALAEVEFKVKEDK